jgi:hypothetical protein
MVCSNVTQILRYSHDKQSSDNVKKSSISISAILTETIQLSNEIVTIQTLWFTTVLILTRKITSQFVVQEQILTLIPTLTFIESHGRRNLQQTEWNYCVRNWLLDRSPRPSWLPCGHFSVIVLWPLFNSFSNYLLILYRNQTNEDKGSPFVKKSQKERSLWSNVKKK